MLGLDVVFEKIFQFGKELNPFEKINHFDRGVRLRFGKPRFDKGGNVRVMMPGLHLRIPFVDEIHSHMIKPTTMDLSEQTITTKDGQSVVVRGVLKYEVHDVATLLLEVDSPAAAVADMSMGIIRDAFVERDWSECNNPSLPGQIAIKIRAEAKKWGIKVIQLTLTDLAIMRSIRLLTPSSIKNI